MALPIGLNDLAKLTLLASDASYFTSSHPVLSGSGLAALHDTAYGIAPQYSVPSGFFEVKQRVDPNTGFGFIAYQNQQTNEVIIALRGTDGPNPQDWVANSQYLGWNQWIERGGGRDLVFGFINSLTNPDGSTFTGEIHFTGQSLGGGLAQYAAYEYVHDQKALAALNGTTFDASRITLTTFNGFGGVLGLQQNLGNYDPTVLADIGSNAHFYTEGDIVSRLGSFNGVGHTGGTTYLLNAHATEINPDTGKPFQLDPLAAHRIETGFYPFLLPGTEFEAATARSIEYLPMQNVQQIAAMFGRILNDQDVSPVESLPRLAAGMIAALSLGDPGEINAFVQAMFANLHAAGRLSDEWYGCLQEHDWGAIARTSAFVAAGATSSAYALSLLTAVLSDALEFQADRYSQLFNDVHDWVSSAVQPVDASMSPAERRIQMDMMMALVPGAAIGSKLAPLLQPLALDLNEMAQKLLTTGSNWLQDTFNFLRDKANTAGEVVGSFMAKLGATFVDVALDCGITTDRLQSYLNEVIEPTIIDTAKGLGNAAAGLIQPLFTTTFNLGRTLGLADIQLIDQAYAAELRDPRLTTVRQAIEEAKSTLDRAAQTVVIQKGVGTNPFHTPGFVPGGASTATVDEKLGQFFRLSLPFAAGTGGQHISLQLQGPQANQLSVVTDEGVLPVGANGAVEVTVPEGTDQLYFSLIASNEVTSDTTVTLSATLLGDNHVATHNPQVESVISLKASVGTIDIGDRYDTITEDHSDIPLESYPSEGLPIGSGGFLHQTLIGGAGPDVGIAFPNGFGDDTLYGNGGDDILNAERGHDVLYGGTGNDTLWGDNIDDHVDTPWHEIDPTDPYPDPRSTQDGKDFLDGGEGNDLLGGGGNDDRLIGGAGDDVLWGDIYTPGKIVQQNPDGSVIIQYTTGVLHPGNDVLEGGEGNDILSGDGGDDTLDGGRGDDILIGDTELPVNATLLYPTTPGNDFLTGGAGNDQLFGNAGNDVLLGGSGNDLLVADQGDDRVFGDEGNDQLFGDEGNDGLRGDDGNDHLDGGAGDDILVGDADGQIGGSGGNDILIGGTGNDTLVGGGGEDTYLVDVGDGFDLIIEAAGEGNRLVFGAGISTDAIVAAMGPNDSLVLRIGNGEQAVQIQNFGTNDLNGVHPIDSFEFSNGIVLTYAQMASVGLGTSGGVGNDQLTGTVQGDRMYGGAGSDIIEGLNGADTLFGEDGLDVLLGGMDNDVLSGGTGSDLLNGGDGDDILYGGAGNDSLEGEAGHDVLVGGTGDDQLNGEAGSDTYRFNLGDGRDTVFDGGPSTDTDTVLFGNGITAGMLTLKADAGQILLKVGTGLDSLALGSTFDVAGSQAIERFQLADGTVILFTDLVAAGFDITGTGDDDVLVGTSVVDRFLGGAGNDRLEGGAGNDTYFFDVSDGVDTIVDTVSTGAGNGVVFGPGIASTDLRLDLAPDQSDPSRKDLLIHVGTNGDALQLDTFDPNNVLGPRTIETFRFADGSTLTYEQLLARGFDLSGTDGADQIIGTNVTDRIMAGAGVDVLKGGVGDDILDGGAGDDRLVGGQGNDTYVFGPGSGHDVIVESQGSLDRIQMAAGVSPADVVVSRSHDDLVLTLTGRTDRLTIFSYFLAPSLQIEQVQFADGTVWDRAAIDNLLRPIITGTSGNDVIVGTSGDDRLWGLAGNDQLTGLAGSDVLDGGSGADRLEGGPGDDTYLVDDIGDVVSESADEGIDTIQSSVTRTLEINVENLTLTGTAINGTGNTLDNILTGNSSANVLTGGPGNDTYVVGAGDTVVELAGEGTDTVQSNRDVTLDANVENLMLTGSASLRGIGNELDNVLSTDGSISVLAGGEGNDTYLIGPNADNDFLVETATGGIDTVIASRGYRLPSHIENLTLLDSPIPDTGLVHGVFVIDPNASGTGIGNDLNNTLRGSRTANVLDGGSGADTMIGGAGDDTYIIDNVGDRVIEQANEGLDTIRTSVSYVLPEHVENLILTGTGAITGTGNTGHNTILGNDAANVLDGGAGNDLLNGGEGADTFLFGVGSGQDIVADATQSGALDTVQVAAELTPEDLGVFQRGEDVVLSLTGTADELILENFYGPSEWGFKQVRFADGTLWNAEDLRTRAVAVGGTVDGTTGDDTLLGGLGHDVLVGGAGNDTLTGGQGNDVLYGDAQTNNPFFPVIGNDTLLGGLGNDVLRDFQGTNLFDGGPGNDTLYLGAGQDTVLFGRGSGGDFITLDNHESDVDVIQFAADIAPADVVLSRQYPDYNIIHLLIPDSGDTLTVMLSTHVGLEATQAVVRFSDGTQWNLVWSPPDLSFATGTVLDDVVSGSPGNLLRGLVGDDTYLVDARSGPVVEQSNEGIDTVQSSIDYTLPANVEKLILVETNSSVIFNPVSGTGNELDNLIVGNTGDNILDGGDGNDVLIGGYIKEEEVGITQPGSDILIGGEGNDILISVGGIRSFVGRIEPITSLNSLFQVVFDDLLLGGVGNDTYIVYSQLETVVESAGEGTDTVQASVSYVLEENVENLTLIGTGSLNGTGNDLANVLIGNEGDNVLDGREGGDTLWGGSALPMDSDIITSGNDTLIGGAGNDTYLFNLGDGIDTIDDVVLPGESNVVQFGEGITRSSLSFSAGSVIIHVGTGGDALHLLHSTVTDPTGPHAVDRFRFADGTEVTYAELLGGSPANHMPTVANPIADQTVLEDTPFTFVVPTNTFADQDVDDTLTYSATLANGTALPSWLSFNATTRTFTGTPDDAQVGTLNLTVTATDSGGLSASSSVALTVQNVNDAPTVVNPLVDQTVLEDAPLTFVVPANTFTDQDRGETLTYSATLANGTALPTWLSFNPATRTFSGTPGSSDVGVFSIKVTATDQGNLNVFDLFELKVNSLDQVLTGTPGNDALLGGTGNDQLFGLAGNDTLTGNAGNDLLDGGTGADTMRGGTGNDTYVVDNTGDAVTENLNEGTDMVKSAITYTLGANIENLTLTGTAAINGTGNALDNILTGNNANNTLTGGTGNDTLNGGAGTDTLVGGAGNDTYVVDAVGDIVTELVNQGTDSVQSSVTFTLGANVENLTLTGTANINGTGSSANNLLVGNSGNNILEGVSGDDTINAGAGNDILLGGSGNDTLNGENGADTLDGGAGDDQLLGGAGSDAITGGSGADQFTGGTGNDTLTGNAGNDVYNFSRGDGQDTIIDSDPFPQNQDRLAFGATINPLDLVISRQVNDLRLSIHGSPDQVTIQNWYVSSSNRTETIQAGNGQTLLSTQVDQLIQAMASFSQQTGLTWDQGIDQRSQDVQNILAASWQ